MARVDQAMVDGKDFKFTRASVQGAQCPVGRGQAFYRDTEQPSLMLRVTANGSRSFIFEQRLAGKTVRVTIGPATMQIRASKDRNGKPLSVGADSEAARLAGLVSQGIDPRVDRATLIATQQAQRESARKERVKLEVSGLDAWCAYFEDRRPYWGERNYNDHLGMVASGGLPTRKRSSRELTKPGILRSLLDRPLASVDVEAIDEWVSRETTIRPTRTALAFRMLRAFLNWCAEHPEYRTIACTAAHQSRRTREKLARKASKSDVLEKEMLRGWFAEVCRLSPAMSACLQVMLLTGCRPGEALALKWEDVDFQWQRLILRDKVEGERVIPLTPYICSLLRELRRQGSIRPELPRRLKKVPTAEEDHELWEPSSWVFVARLRTGERVTDPSHSHRRALIAAGLPHISLNGLRRSFGTLVEWVEVPVGIVAQLQGHKPSATAEKHYRVRPIDLLRLWHTRIEEWVLKQTDVSIGTPHSEQVRVVAPSNARNIAV
jgi:integrase